LFKFLFLVVVIIFSGYGVIFLTNELYVLVEEGFSFSGVCFFLVKLIFSILIYGFFGFFTYSKLFDIEKHKALILNFIIFGFVMSGVFIKIYFLLLLFLFIMKLNKYRLFS